MSLGIAVLSAGSLVLVVLTHVFEALNALPWTRCGLENSAGHYIDLSSAVFAATLFHRLSAAGTQDPTPQ